MRARALKYLALREHSRAELGQKLARHAQEGDDVGALLDDLERAGHLSEARFVESLVRRRASRFGARRIEQEMAQHKLPADATAGALASLRTGERERAQAVWARRFGQPPADITERARQHRFLASRGFDGSTIAWVLKNAGAGSED